MKKTFLITTWFILLGIAGCSSEMEDSYAGENAEDFSLLSVSPPEFYAAIGEYIASYDKIKVPADQNGERLHKTVFSAAMSMFLAPERFGDGDTYAAVYQSWRIGSGLYLGTQTLSPATANDEITAEEALAQALAAAVANRGDLYYQALEVVNPSLFHSYNDNQKLSTSITNVSLLLNNTVDIDLFQALFDMNDLTPVVNNSLLFQDPDSEVHSLKPYQGCFTFRDGLGYFYEDASYNEHAVAVLELCLPVVVTLKTDAERNTFVEGLRTILNRSGNEKLLPSGDAAKVLNSLYAAAYASAFWKPMLDPFSDYYLEVNRPGVIQGRENGKFLLKITSNGDWRIVKSGSLSTYVSLSKTSGTGNDWVIVRTNDSSIAIAPTVLDFFLDNVSTTTSHTSILVTHGVSTEVKAYYFSPSYYAAPNTSICVQAAEFRSLDSNIEWYVDMSALPDWVSSVYPTSGTGSSPISFCHDMIQFGLIPVYRQADLKIRDRATGNVLATLPIDQTNLWYF